MTRASPSWSRLYARVSIFLTGDAPPPAGTVAESEAVTAAYAAAMRASMCHFLVFAGFYFLINTLFYRVAGDPGYVPIVSLLTLVMIAGFWAYNRRAASLFRLEITGHVVGLTFIGNALLDIAMEYRPIKLMYLLLLVPAFAVSGVRPRVVYSTSLVSIAGMLIAAWRFDRAQFVDCVWVAFTGLVLAVGLATVTRSAMIKAVHARIMSDRSRDQAITLATYDTLTGLPNRRAFLKTFDEHLARPGAFYLGLLDLDGFKPINDIYGHASGDQVLVEVARRLCVMCGPKAVVARLGGDEFAVILPGLYEKELRTLGDDLCALLAEPYALDSETAYLSVSVGFTERAPDDDNASRLLERADYALYEAKERGRGMAVLFDRVHEARVRSTKEVEQALRGIDGEKELTLAFQPQYDIGQQRTVGFEALARWHSEKLGRVAPDVFIRAAERSGMITTLTPMLLEKALTAARTWPEDMGIAFNLSARDLLSPKGVDHIIAVVKASGVAATRIEFEITETAMLTDFTQAQRTISRLSDMGCRIALDDFGSGYTNFTYLNRVKVDKVKIDRAFVLELGKSDAAKADQARKIIKSMVELAGTLGMGHVVEGVETAEELREIRAAGATLVQGYLFGRPMPAEDISGFLAQENQVKEHLTPDKPVTRKTRSPAPR